MTCPPRPRRSARRWRATFDAALADPEVAANLGTLVRAAHWAGFGLDPRRRAGATPASCENQETRAG